MKKKWNDVDLYYYFFRSLMKLFCCCFFLYFYQSSRIYNCSLTLCPQFLYIFREKEITKKKKKRKRTLKIVGVAFICFEIKVNEWRKKSFKCSINFPPMPTLPYQFCFFVFYFMKLFFHFLFLIWFCILKCIMFRGKR